MKDIFIIFKKELKRFLTDKRMIATLLLPGVLIFCIYSLMGTFFQDMTANGVDPDTQYVVYIDRQPAEFSVFNGGAGMYNINVNQNGEQTSDGKKAAVASGEAELYIIYEEDFYAKMEAYTPASGQPAPQVEIYYNSTSTTSQTMYTYYTACLDAFEHSLANKFDVNAGGGTYDLASETELTAYILGLILPMILNTLLLAGCLSVAAESIAGEKERGTIATLLVTPVRRSHLALGKVFALALVALISAASSFLGLILSLPRLLGMNFTAVPYGIGDYFAILVIIILNVLLFTVILTIISTFAKSVKEATGFATPFMVLLIVLSLLSSVLPMNGLAGYFIPIFNSVLCLTSLLNMSFNLIGFFITMVIDLLLFGLGVFVLAKMFNNEKIMFNK